jgi:hypothetical protein
MDNPSIRKRISDASATSKDTATIERTVWDSLPDEIRDQLGRTRLRQLIAVELNDDPDQLLLAFEGERYSAEDLAPDILEHEAQSLRARAAGLIRRAERLEAQARRRREG